MSKNLWVVCLLLLNFGNVSAEPQGFYFYASLGGFGDIIPKMGAISVMHGTTAYLQVTHILYTQLCKYPIFHRLLVVSTDQECRA